MNNHQYHIAQVNIARMKAPLHDPLMADFVSQIDHVNSVAEASPGFVWRFTDEDGNDATGTRPFDQHTLFNMSVWESVEALRDYVFRSIHIGPMRDREKWFDKMHGPHLAMWWLRAGSLPTIDEAKRRLTYLREFGPTPQAFTFVETFPHPQK